MTILGIDISKWDGNWDAKKAKQAGATFVFIKASEATVTDPQFVVNWQKAKDAGLVRGAYHYLDYTKPGADQANYFADLLKDDPGELPPVIDYELRRTDNDPSAALVFLRDCLDQLTKRTELFENASFKRPMIYTSPGFWVEYGDQTKRDYWIQFPLWNAHWITANTPKVPSPWTMWHFWQFTSKGPGEAFGSECLSMDMNRFNGTLSELMEFSGIGIPVVNHNEKLESLETKVRELEGAVSSISQNGIASASDALEKVDALESKISDLDGSLNTLSASLSKRIEAIEKTINDLGNAASPQSIPTEALVAVPPSVDIPDDSQVQDGYPADPPATADVVAAAPISTVLQSDSPVPANLPPEIPIQSNTGPGNIPFAICITKALNVRSGPDASAPIVASLRYGQRVKIINRQDGWAEFQDPAGWSVEAYLSIEQNDAVAPDGSSQSSNTSDSYGICNTSGLNVRSGPGAATPIVGGLIYGQRIKILAHSSGWAQIETPPGWCNESYLSFA
jgi:lysozyme